MSSVGATVRNKGVSYTDKKMWIRTSEDMLNWSDPVMVEKDGEGWGNHYVAITDLGTEGQPYVLKTDKFGVLTNSNGTDVTCYLSKFVKKH